MEDTPVTVVAVETVGPDAIAVVLETPDGFDAAPGQFIKFTTEIDGETHSRFYTISSPTVSETFELTVGIDPDGAVSPALETLDAGETVTLSGPYGNAYYEGESRVLVLAGGPGVGPAVGIAERTIADGGDVAVVYQDDEPIHQERLAELDSRGAAVDILTREQSLAEAVSAVDLADRQVFVYGFADFLDASMSAIAAAGGSPDEAKVENFG